MSEIFGKFLTTYRLRLSAERMSAEIFLNYTWKAPRKKSFSSEKNSYFYEMIGLTYTFWCYNMLNIFESRFRLSMKILKNFY